MQNPKILSMVRQLCDNDSSPEVSWPIETIHRGFRDHPEGFSGQSGRFSGFLKVFGGFARGFPVIQGFSEVSGGFRCLVLPVMLCVHRPAFTVSVSV